MPDFNPLEPIAPIVDDLSASVAEAWLAAQESASVDWGIISDIVETGDVDTVMRLLMGQPITPVQATVLIENLGWTLADVEDYTRSLEQAAISGSYGDTVHADWVDELASRRFDAERDLLAGMAAGGMIDGGRLPDWLNLAALEDPYEPLVRPDYRGGRNDPRPYASGRVRGPLDTAGEFYPQQLLALDWARGAAARLVRPVADRQAISEIVTLGLAAGRSGEQMAADIRRVIGLHHRWAMAVHRYHQGMLDKGIAPNIARMNAGKYRQRLLKARSKMIARTEMNFAANQGRLLQWQAETEAGMLDGALARKVWMTAPERTLQGRQVCDICAPMDEVEVTGVDNSFTLPDGRQLLMPPVHPNCRCTVYVLPPEVAIDTQLGHLRSDIMSGLRSASSTLGVDVNDLFDKITLDDPDFGLAGPASAVTGGTNGRWRLELAREFFEDPQAYFSWTAGTGGDVRTRVMRDVAYAAVERTTQRQRLAGVVDEGLAQWGLTNSFLFQGNRRGRKAALESLGSPGSPRELVLASVYDVMGGRPSPQSQAIVGALSRSLNTPYDAPPRLSPAERRQLQARIRSAVGEWRKDYTPPPPGWVLRAQQSAQVSRDGIERQRAGVL